MKTRRKIKAAMALFETTQMLLWSYLVALTPAHAAETIIKPGTTARPEAAGKMYLQTAADELVPAVVVYTTDGNGNLVPLPTSAGEITIGSFNQGDAGTEPEAWYVRDEAARASLANIEAAQDVAASTRASEATLSALNTKVPSGLTVTSTRLLVDGSGVTQPVSAASLPLPTGASTQADQATGNASLSSIDGKLNSLGQKAMAGSAPVVIASDQSPIPVTGMVSITGVATEATLADLNSKVVAVDTDNVTVVSSALPTGAATEATVATLATEATLASIDGKTPALGQAAKAASVPVTLASDSDTLPVSVASLPLPTGAATEATLATRASEATLAALDAKVTAVDTDNVTVTASALPAGAATEAKQDAGNATLTTIEGKIAPLGQAASAASHPVVIASDQSAVPVSGTVATSNGATEVTLAALNAKVTAVDTGNVTVAASALPTGASTAANQATGNASLASIDGKQRAYDADTGAGTENVQGVVLRKSASGGSVELGTATDPVRVDPTGTTIQPVSGTVSSAQSGTWNINNITGTVSLPTGAATSANQTTGNTSLISIDSKLNTLGQKAMSGSVPVTIASDQNSVPVSQSGTWNIQNISGSINLPIGASTAAAQTTTNNLLTSLDNKVNSLGQKSMANSTPVVLASDQSTLPVSVSGTLNVGSIAGPVALPTGASTAANQNTGNTALISIDGKMNSLGQKTAAASMPVILASDQPAVPSSQSGAWNITNVTGTVSLPTGASTSANQATGNASLSSLDTKTPALGQTTMANSRPVVIASNQSAIPASQSGTWNVTNISGTVSLPTGASTAANQTSGAQKTQLVDSGGTNMGTTANPVFTASRSALTANAPGQVSVGTGSTALVASNASRKGLIVTNVSAAIVSLAIGTTAVSGSGIVLYPGGSWVMDQYSFATGAINAIATAGASLVSVQEFQ